ncbi:tumor necrosis factor ligand superfamily member 6-like [Rhinoraja longicauda]
MGRRNTQSMEMLEYQSCGRGKGTLADTSPFPVQRIEKKMVWINACNSLIVVMLLIALAGLAFALHSLYQLQHQVTQMNRINDNPQSSSQKHTGKSTAAGSDRLLWEARLGNAFLEGMLFEDNALVINKTGQYFIYSKVHFRGIRCQSSMLHQTIHKRDSNYPDDLSLMRVREVNYCTGSQRWEKGTFQAGMFHLNEGAELFVSVSHPSSVSSDEFLTFFGLYKI